MVAESLSNHPNDKGEAEPTLAALDNGYFSPSPIDACEKRGIEPYIATGRPAHRQPWPTFFAQADTPLPEEASPKVKRAFKLQAALGREIYRLRCISTQQMGSVLERVEIAA